jgi:acyl-CoA thioesterase I
LRTTAARLRLRTAEAKGGTKSNLILRPMDLNGKLWAMNAPRLLAFLVCLPLIARAVDEPIRVACMGDSLTMGAKVNVATESYPAQLQEMLGARFVVKNFGVGGATMMRHGKPNAFAQLPKALAFQPNIVVVAFGTNDSRSRGVDYWDHIAEFVPDARSIIDQLAALPTSPRILLCLPASHMADLPGMPADRRENNTERVPRMQKIRELLSDLAEKTRGKKVTLVDLETPTKGKADLFDPDGVHLRAAGYRLLAETIKPHVEKAEKE